MAEGRRQAERRYAKRCNSLRTRSKLILLISRERDRKETGRQRVVRGTKCILLLLLLIIIIIIITRGTETFVALNSEDSEAVPARPSGKGRLVAR
jgi:hypothetical protein